MAFISAQKTRSIPWLIIIFPWFIKWDRLPMGYSMTIWGVKASLN
jgi:hypothetical protein